MSEKINLRNAAVLAAAMELAEQHGFTRITRDQVATRAGVAAGSVNNAFGNMNALRDAVVREAVEKRNVVIVGQGLAAGHGLAKAAPDDLKAAALARLAA